MTASPPLKARKPRGFQDLLDRQAGAEDHLVRVVSGVYEAWGFRRLETPALEFTDALGKYLPDVDRPNAGVFSIKDDDEQWMSLRYDLTAPLARYVAEHWNDLPKPFRRWQAGPVWRNEKPGPGRFRQFTQCDADTVGAAGPGADAEMIMMAGAALEAVGITRADYSVRVNSRRLLNGVLDRVAEASALNLTETKLTVLRAIDKLDRLGPSGVAALLGVGRRDESGDFTKGAGLPADAIETVLAFLQAGESSRAQSLARLEKVVGTTEEGRAGLAEMRAIQTILESCNIPESCAAFDPAIVRGLEYYTGPVFEAHVTLAAPGSSSPVSFGSVGGGGRYDDLIARFRGEAAPATGFSIGVSRLLAVLEAVGSPLGAQARAPVVVLSFEADRIGEMFALAMALRQGGVDAEVYVGAAGMKAQMKYADRRGAPVVVMYGADEKARGEVTLKDLRAGAQAAQALSSHAAWREERPGQISAPVGEIVEAVKALLARAAEPSA